MASSVIQDYIGYGLAADRPVAPDIATGASASYYATDTGVLSVWDGSAWQTPISGSLSGKTTSDLAEGSNKYFTDERAQDAIGAMVIDTATIDVTYTDATPELKWDVINDSITYAKMQNVSAASKLLGRGNSGSGDTQEITLGTNLSMSGTTVNAASGASGANPSATAGDVAVNGSAITFMRSDGAPAIQKGSSSAFGVVKVDGSTITASGGVISAAGGATPIFKGAKVKKSTDQTAADYTTKTAFAFDAEDFDTDTFHDNVTNNTRLTIPSGVSYVTLVGQFSATGQSTAATLALTIDKNGTTIAQHVDTVGTASPSLQLVTGPIAVTAADYFEFTLTNTTDSSITVVAAKTFFSLAVLA